MAGAVASTGNTAENKWSEASTLKHSVLQRRLRVGKKHRSFYLHFLSDPCKICILYISSGVYNIIISKVGYM